MHQSTVNNYTSLLPDVLRREETKQKNAGDIALSIVRECRRY